MGSVFKKTYTLALPDNAEIITRKGKQFARWKPARGKTRTAPLTRGEEESLRILVRSRTFTAKFRDGSGQVVERATGCRDADAARSVLSGWEKREERVRAGLLTPGQDAIARQNVVPLSDHVDEYLTRLAAKGCSSKYRTDQKRYLRGVFKACHFQRLSDLERDPVESWLFAQFDSGMGARTMNAHRAAAVTFASWCVKAKRLEINPFDGIPKANEKADRRRPRRALNELELVQLIRAARTRPLQERLRITQGKHKGELRADLAPETRRKLDRLGWGRSLIYKALATTGLRVSEARSITVSQLELDASVPHAVLYAADEKNRKGSHIPLRSDLVSDLRVWLREKLHVLQECARGRGEPIPVRLPGETPVFDLSQEFLKIFNRDLAAANIPKKDGRGRSADLHSLRYSFGSLLSARGVPLRTAQAALRHSDPKLTANVYTDPVLLDVAGAIEALPDLPIDAGDDKEEAKATGTEDPDPWEILAPILAPKSGLPSTTESSSDKTGVVLREVDVDFELEPAARKVNSSHEKKTRRPRQSTGQYWRPW